MGERLLFRPRFRERFPRHEVNALGEQGDARRGAGMPVCHPDQHVRKKGGVLGFSFMTAGITVLPAPTLGKRAKPFKLMRSCPVSFTDRYLPAMICTTP